MMRSPAQVVSEIARISRGVQAASNDNHRS